MKKLFATLVMIFGIALFSQAVFAQAGSFLEKEGTADSAMKDFYRAVVSSGGTANRNVEVPGVAAGGEFSVGLAGIYVANMTMTEKDGKVRVKMIFKKKEEGLSSLISGPSVTENAIGEKVENAMLGMGYRDIASQR